MATFPVKGADNANYNVQPVTVGPAAKAASQPVMPATDLDNIEPAGVPVAGTAMPTGGVGITGWLSAIWSAVSGSNTATGAKADAAATNSTSSWSVVALLKGIYAVCAAATPAGSNIIGSILGRTASVIATSTVSTSAYAAGDAVGGLWTFTSALDSAFSGILQDIVVRSKSQQTAALKLYLFSANPTATTVTDNSPVSLAGADIPKLIGCFPLGLSDTGIGSMAIWSSDGIAAAIKATSANLYGILVTTSAMTLASTADITVETRTLKD